MSLFVLRAIRPGFTTEKVIKLIRQFEFGSLPITRTRRNIINLCKHSHATESVLVEIFVRFPEAYCAKQEFCDKPITEFLINFGKEN